MKTTSIIKFLTILILSGVLFVGCKKDVNQNSAGSVSTTSQKQLSLAEAGATGHMTYRNTFYNTDYLSVGTGGLRDIGYAQIRVIGTFPLSSVYKAFLYWHGNSTIVEEVGKTMKFNTNTITGTNIGITAPNNGGDSGPEYEVNTQAYRADVTALVKASTSRYFKVSDFGKMNPDGASLVLFYQDGDNSNNRDIVLYDGNDYNGEFPGYPGNPNAPFDPLGWDINLSGINYTSGKVIMTMHVADGQYYHDGTMFLNGVEMNSRTLFEGNTVPGAIPGVVSARWDIKQFDLGYWLRPDVKSLHVTLDDYFDDQLSLVVVVFNLPKGVAPVNTIQVPFDYRPLRCPNTLRTSSSAEEAAILGTSTFDVNKVDLSSVKLNGIPFKKSRIIDKSAPFSGTISDCSTCSALPADGIKDLEFLFDSQLLLKTLGTVKDKQCIKVTLTGKLLPQYGSTPFKGADYIVISKD